MTIAGTITTGSNPRTLFPGVQSFWGDYYDEHASKWKAMYDTASSDKKYEIDQEQTGFGLAPAKNEGDAISYDSAKALATTQTNNITYGLGFKITREAIEDNQYYDDQKRLTRGLAESMMSTKEFKGALKFANNDLIGDGKAIFATDHPVVGAAQTNILGTPAVLSRASLEDISIETMRAKDNRGKPMRIAPRSLIVGVADSFQADRILHSYLQPDNDSNALNVVNALFADGYTANPFFNGFNDDLWYIRTNVMDSCKHYVRREMELSPDNDFDTDNLKVKATERYSFTVVDFRGVYAGKV